MATGYEDIDNLMNQQNNLLNEQQKKQAELINQQTQIQTDELNHEKEKIDKEVNKTTQGLYANWQKQSNQYGVQAEQLAQQGLLNSGYAETTKTALYNTYQRNVTDTLNNARDLKSDYDFKIAQARQQGSVQQAQAALDLYMQKAQLLTQNYELRQNREQYLYQQERDRISDNQWQKTFDEQIRQNEIENQWKQKQFEYQKERDAISDSQWQKQYELSKKASASSSKKSSSRSTSQSGGLSVSNNKISDYANTVANNLLNLKNTKGIAGKMNSAIITQSKNIVADMVNKGTLSVDEARYIFDKVGI